MKKIFEWINGFFIVVGFISFVKYILTGEIGF